LAFTSVVAFVLCAYACGTGNTTGITPLTGIVVRADDLVAGHGCGTGPDQIYKYSVVISTFEEAGSASVYVAGGTYDCFADATLINLCASTSGSLTFSVNVFAFTQAQWFAQKQNADDSYANTLTDNLVFPSYCVTDAGGQSLAEFYTEVTPTTPVNDLLSVASFETTCTATQQENIGVVAVCNTLTAVPPPITTP
jgi:hypothetical protein